MERLSLDGRQTKGQMTELRTTCQYGKHQQKKAQRYDVRASRRGDHEVHATPASQLDALRSNLPAAALG